MSRTAAAEDFALDASLAALYLAGSLFAFRYCVDSRALDVSALRTAGVLLTLAGLVASRAPAGLWDGCRSGCALGVLAAGLAYCFCQGGGPSTYLWLVTGSLVACAVVGVTRLPGSSSSE
jgi:hypothetical protein